MAHSNRTLAGMLLLLTAGMALWVLWPRTFTGSLAQADRRDQSPPSNRVSSNLMDAVPGDQHDSILSGNPGAKRERESPQQQVQTEQAAEPLGVLPFRGRVLDVATDEPVPQALVKLTGSEQAAPTDSEGRFEGDATIHPNQVLRIFDPVNGTHIRDASFADLRLELDGSVTASIAIGPTTRFFLPPELLDSAESWVARLILRPADGLERECNWQPVRRDDRSAADVAWFRYDNPLLESPQQAPGIESILLQVKNTEETVMATGTVPTAIGIAPGIVRLTVSDRLGFVHGTLTDLKGSPVKNATIYAIPNTPSADPANGLGAGLHPKDVRSSEDGTFRIKGLDPGPWSLLFNHRSLAAPLQLLVQVVPGPLDTGPIVLDVRPFVGSIRGIVVAESGGIPNDLYVSLKALDGSLRTIDTINGPHWGKPSSSYVDFGQVSQDRVDGTGVARTKRPFAHNDLPAGRYQLAVIDPSGARWSPAVAVVEAPQDGLVFTRIEDNSIENLSIEATDMSDSSRLDVVGVRVERHGLALFSQFVQTGPPEMRLSLGGETQIYVYAPGYKTYQVSAAEIIHQNGDAKIRVALQPGWSGQLILLDCEGRLDVVDLNSNGTWLARQEHPPLANISVLVDGEVVARTGRDGIARLDLAAPPAGISFQSSAGFQFLASRRIERGRWQGDEREGVVWMFRP